MQKQTFIDNMAERGYEPKTNGSATKGDNTIRHVPPADHIVRVSTQP